jgi:hypothetical protein
MKIKTPNSFDNLSRRADLACLPARMDLAILSYSFAAKMCGAQNKQ